MALPSGGEETFGLGLYDSRADLLCPGLLKKQVNMHIQTA